MVGALPTPIRASPEREPAGYLQARVLRQISCQHTFTRLHLTAWLSGLGRNIASLIASSCHRLYLHTA